ncbi:hypothetical protein DFH09DRAFT_1400933 [Mycena vulgaris]|nr:hypothetical protein DFH09DRAFT_1400933 [Mycena vulgaris]
MRSAFIVLFLALSVAARPRSNKRKQNYAVQRRGTQFVTGTCASDSDCQQGCCGFSTGKCAGPAVAQTDGSGGCGHGNASPNCNVAAALGLSGSCIAGGLKDGVNDPAVQAAAAFAANLDNLPFTPASGGAPPAGNNNAAPPTAPPPPGVPAAQGTGASAEAIALQTSLTLDPSVICTNFTDDGQTPPSPGQTKSSTSTNNYINFCALTLPKVALTNGLQNTEGSCNPAPIGLIPAVDKMPSAKFTFPKNFGTVPANVPFNATLQLKNLAAGVFTNAAKTYFAAPQKLDPTGLIIGHSHFVIDKLTSLDQILPTDPKKPFFFKGVNDAGVNGLLTVLVTPGPPAGVYRLCTINSSSNHQPVIVPIAQHGSLDDCIYVRLPSHIHRRRLLTPPAVHRRVDAEVVCSLSSEVWGWRGPYLGL